LKWIDLNWGGKPSWRKFAWLSSWVERINLKHATIITCVSRVLKEELVARGIDANKIVVNPNAVDTHDFNPARLVSDRDEIRAQLDVKDCYVFGFVGTFSAWHGINMLAEMIPQVVARTPQTHFLLIGDGPMLSSLKSQLERAGIDGKYVTFTGMVPQHEAKRYLAACNAFLCPTQPNVDGSKFFGSPTKLFEYMSMAKPIIASDLEQLSEILSPAVKWSGGSLPKNITNELAIVIPPKDVEGFVKAACQLAAADSSLSAAIGENARKKALQDHTWHEHVRIITAHIKRV